MVPTIIRRLEQRRVEVLFGSAVPEDSDRGRALLELAAKPETHLIRENGAIAGVVAAERDYMGYLRAVSAPKEEIRSVRAALDDSKKARRERMRG